MRSSRCVPLLLAAACAIAAQDDAPPQGMEVIPLVKKAATLVAGHESPVPGRPWSDDLAALTDPDPSVNGPAVGRLVSRGAEVLPDLGVIAGDRDWQLRVRVARVAANIGGRDGAPLVLRLSHDPHPNVRRLATVGLRRCRGDDVLVRLRELLASGDPDERTEAAGSLGALADPRAISDLVRLRADPDGPARDAQARALRELLALPEAGPLAANLLGSATGDPRLALLEALTGATDTRLCPVLTVLVDNPESLVALLACRALATCGDWRAVEPLVRLAASTRRAPLPDTAATALRTLTGYPAGAGQAWTLWWHDNAERAARLAGRDALLAGLMDPAGALPDLAAWPVGELGPLVDAAMQHGRPVPPWYAARAMAVLRAQGGRWTQTLRDRAAIEADNEDRLDLLVVIDEVGGPDAHDAFLFLREALAKREAKALEVWKDKGLPPPDASAERALIAIGIARQR